MNKLYKSKYDKVIFGVIGGIGEFLNIDSNLLRIVAAIFFIRMPFSFIIFYLISSIIIPEDTGIIEYNYDENQNTKNFLGISLIAFGVLSILKRLIPKLNISLFRPIQKVIIYITKFWPILLVTLGVYILASKDDKYR